MSKNNVVGGEWIDLGGCAVRIPAGMTKEEFLGLGEMGFNCWAIAQSTPQFMTHAEFKRLCDEFGQPAHWCDDGGAWEADPSFSFAPGDV